MSRDIIVLLKCDVCPPDGTNQLREGIKEDIPIQVGKTRREVDLCPEHEAELTGAVEKFFAAGRKIKRQKAETTPAPAANGSTTKEKLQCPECDKFYSGPQGLGSHRKRAHGVNGTGGKRVEAASKLSAARKRSAAKKSAAARKRGVKRPTKRPTKRTTKRTTARRRSAA